MTRQTSRCWPLLVDRWPVAVALAVVARVVAVITLVDEHAEARRWPQWRASTSWRTRSAGRGPRGRPAHGLWEVYHYRVDLVVSRSWAQFCAIVDLGVGIALVVASAG
ncbi:hypothetical protein [Micromonospora sp. WMMD1155]|uniref:hypothetical protein n=1 Tax=Micromonospora sp. WMMD1155 TaxID=3016094 RepID=UPI00249CBB56|nr:hypothetical protein [Micromonospora sp. WMMD1155]WFE52396.1 hypothetical protein O7617_19650 [Micromonospora sp. WMMD1155]